MHLTNAEKKLELPLSTIMKKNFYSQNHYIKIIKSLSRWLILHFLSKKSKMNKLMRKLVAKVKIKVRCYPQMKKRDLKVLTQNKRS